MFFSLAYLLSALLWFISFSPLECPESAWVFAVPVLIVNLCAVNSKKKLWTGSFLMCFVVWFLLLIWLRFVYPPAGILAVIFLPAIVALFYAPFFALSGYFLSENFANTNFKKIFAMFALASLWVLLEFIRSNIFTGFGWLCLGHSQYNRPALIQSASIGGTYLVSFIIIIFNIAIAKYIVHIYRYNRNKIKRIKNTSRFCPEFYVGIILLMLNIFLYAGNLPKKANLEYLFRAGTIQTDFVGFRKWQKEFIQSDLNIISNLSWATKEARADIVLFPEASTPPTLPLFSGDIMQRYLENLSSKLDIAILGGFMSFKNNYNENLYQNSVFFISEKTGLKKEEYYAKIKLVPFGEYVPFWCSFIDEIVPVANTMKRGTNTKPFDIEIANKTYKLGTMICYEDIFEGLGRNMVNEGASLLFVCTNDSWYGKEAGAYQHSAHSALQAVSTRRILLRSSNNGLSCVFNQYGAMLPTITLMAKDGKAYNGENSLSIPVDIENEDAKALNPYSLKILKSNPLKNEEGSIYFRGAGYTDVYSYKNFDDKKSIYVRYGYLFPYLCLAIVILYIARRKLSIAS